MHHCMYIQVHVRTATVLEHQKSSVIVMLFFILKAIKTVLLSIFLNFTRLLVLTLRCPASMTENTRTYFGLLVS